MPPGSCLTVKRLKYSFTPIESVMGRSDQKRQERQSDQKSFILYVSQSLSLASSNMTTGGMSLVVKAAE